MENVIEKRCRTRNKTPKGFLVPLVFLLLFFPPGFTASSVTWLPNLEWNTVNNWANNFPPKNGTHVVFPVEMRLSVGLPALNTPLDIAGLELPRDGSLALPENGILTISESNDSVKTASWSLQGPLLWVNPDNWRSEKSSNAVPHLERIPCQDDVVILPGSKRIVSIQLPDTMGTTVRAVRVMDDTGNLPPWEWRTQIQSQREIFSGPISVGYTGVQSCLDCSCQPEAIGRKILKEVCNTKGAICSELECEYPLNIEGHCCYYCGARVILSNKTSLSLANRVADLALRNFVSTLSWYARRTWDSKTEILIAGNKGYSAENTIEGVTTLTSILKEQGIQALSIDTTGAEVHISKWAAVVGPFFGTLLLVIILLLAAFPYSGYSLPQVLGESWRGFRELVNRNENEGLVTGRESTLPRKPFRFAKFENAPESEVELATSSEVVTAHAAVQDDDDDDDDEDQGGRFANPLYRSGRRQPEVQTFSALQRLHDDTADEEIDLAIEP